MHQTYSLGVVDVDGDNDLDVVAGNEGQINRLYLGDGSGGFSSGSDMTSDAHGTKSLSVGDVDGDGDLDLILGNNGQANRLYRNALPPLYLSDSNTDGVPDLTPIPAFSRAPSNSALSATFDQALSASTVDTTSFVVHSSQRGRLFDDSNVVLSANGTRATFTPDSLFFPGETVFATLTTGISSATGLSLNRGYVWHFAGAVSACLLYTSDAADE
mgnify:FL=1